MSPRTDLVLIVPAYNEEHRLVLEEFRQCLSGQPRVSFLFVDDGSTDGTVALLGALRAEFEGRIEILSLVTNEGKAEAVRQGMLHALETAPLSFVGYWDADLATPFASLPDFLGVLDRNPAIDIVIGARVLLMGRRIHRRIARHLLGRLFATAASMAIGMPVYDTQCGAKVFRPTPALHATLNQAWGSKWIFDVELLSRLVHRHGMPVHAIWEQPVTAWQDIAGSHLKSRDFLRAPIELYQIWRDRTAASRQG